MSIIGMKSKKLKNKGEQQEADDAKMEGGRPFGKGRRPTLRNELQQARSTLQEAEISKSEPEAGLNKVNTNLKTKFQKALKLC